MTPAPRTITALLVGEQDGCLPILKECLEDLGMKTTWVKRLNQMRAKLLKTSEPHVVFAATEPADATWQAVVEAAKECGRSPVILACRVVDVPKYLDALERGAFDFVVPPFGHRDIRFIVESAVARVEALGFA